MKLKARCSAAVLLIITSSVAGDGPPASAGCQASKSLHGTALANRDVRELSAIDEMWEQSSRVSLDF
jgi:hypothetical protein